MKAHSYIRYSSTAQDDNHSLEHQTESTQNYCVENKLDLISTYTDKAVSSKDGKNWIDAEEATDKLNDGKTISALANFYLECIDGTIKTPCALIIDTTDRFSRGGITRGVSNINTLLDLNIEIHLLAENLVIKPLTDPTPSELNMHNMQCMMLCMALAQGQAENVNKSYKLKNAFKACRKNNTGNDIKRVASGTSPFWIDHVDIPTMPKAGSSNPILYYKQYAINEEQADLVKYIYKKALKSSVADISLLLKKEKGIEMTIYKIHAVLSNHAVYGCLFPRRTNRKGSNEPILDHYPAIMSKAQFQKVQGAIAERRTYGKGRKTKLDITNYWREGKKETKLFFVNDTTVFLKSSSRKLADGSTRMHYYFKNVVDKKDVFSAPKTKVDELILDLAFKLHIDDFNSKDNAKDLQEWNEQLNTLSNNLITCNNKIKVLEDELISLDNTLATIKAMDILMTQRELIETVINNHYNKKPTNDFCVSHAFQRMHEVEDELSKYKQASKIFRKLYIAKVSDIENSIIPKSVHADIIKEHKKTDLFVIGQLGDTHFMSIEGSFILLRF